MAPKPWTWVTAPRYRSLHYGVQFLVLMHTYVDRKGQRPTFLRLNLGRALGSIHRLEAEGRSKTSFVDKKRSMEMEPREGKKTKERGEDPVKPADNMRAKSQPPSPVLAPFPWGPQAMFRSLVSLLPQLMRTHLVFSAVYVCTSSPSTSPIWIPTSYNR